MDIKQLAEMFLDSGYSAALLNDTIKDLKAEREAEKLKQKSKIRESRDNLIQAAFNYAYVAGLATQKELDSVSLDKINEYMDSIEKSIKALKQMKITIKPVDTDMDMDIIKRFVEGI